MKNILVIEPSGHLYGSEMVLLDIITNTDKKKYNYIVALPPKSKFSNLLKKHNIESIDLIDISSKVKKIISYVKLYFYINRNKPDLIFVNQAGIQKIISYLAILFNIPVVSEVSTLEDGILINKFKNKLHDPVKAYICNSNFIASKVRVPENKKSVLYYGYEWKKLNPSINKSATPFNIVLLGRISTSKGHFLLVEALNILQTKRKDIDIKIYFIGSAPSLAIENEIRQKIKEYNLEDKFIFRGFQTNINKELNNMNLMVIPSIQEPFGRIFCETAEAELPCLVADTGGLGELSKEFNLGITFNGKDSLSLCDQIIYCYDNYTLVKSEFGMKAHPFLQKLNKTNYIKKMEEILDAAIDKNNISTKWLGDNE